MSKETRLRALYRDIEHWLSLAAQRVDQDKQIEARRVLVERDIQRRAAKLLAHAYSAERASR